METALSSTKENKLSLDSVEVIVELFESCQEEWQEELLKHYLLNFILYLNMQAIEREKTPIKKTLLKIEHMLENAAILVKNTPEYRIVDSRIMKNKVREKKGKSKTPRQKFKNNSKKLNERTKKKEDYSIDFEVKKSSKFK